MNDPSIKSFRQEFIELLNKHMEPGYPKTRDAIYMEFLKESHNVFNRARNQMGEIIKGVRLSQVIAIWELLHTRDTGDVGFADLERAIGKVCGVINDIPQEQPTAEESASIGADKPARPSS